MRTDVLYQCPLCHADFIALIEPAALLPPDRCWSCGHHLIDEQADCEVRFTIRETGSQHARF